MTEAELLEAIKAGQWAYIEVHERVHKGARVTGKIDRIEFVGEYLHIIQSQAGPHDPESGKITAPHAATTVVAVKDVEYCDDAPGVLALYCKSHIFTLHANEGEFDRSGSWEKLL